MTRTVTGRAFDQERLRLALTAIFRAFDSDSSVRASYTLGARNSRLNGTGPKFFVTRTVNWISFGALRSSFHEISRTRSVTLPSGTVAWIS